MPARKANPSPVKLKVKPKVKVKVKSKSKLKSKLGPAINRLEGYLKVAKARAPLLVGFNAPSFEDLFRAQAQSDASSDSDDFTPEVDTTYDHDAMLLVFPILRFFEYTHLPPHLRAVSQYFYDVAMEMTERHTKAGYSECKAGLRDLLKAKDAFVRAELARSF